MKTQPTAMWRSYSMVSSARKRQGSQPDGDVSASMSLMSKPLLLLLCLSWLGLAQDRTELTTASSAYKNGDYQTALNLLRPLAEKGVPEAETRLGYLYCEGKIIPRDEPQAIALLQSAAEHGLAE